MPLIAARARTSLSIAGAVGAVVGALLLSPSARPSIDPSAYGEDGVRVDARLWSAIVPRGEHDVAITITTPPGAGTRAPLSLVVVIDRSGSMAGQPLVDAKRAASKLVDRLVEGDAFSIITYSSTDETVMPMTLVSADAKRNAQAGIAAISDEGGTCISCGLTRARRELAASPHDIGLRRIVLISDGQANEGIFDRDELAQLTTSMAAEYGTSISSVGVGLDFDEVTMVRLANVGRGNYYFVEDAAGLDAMFARELGGLVDTIGVNAKLVLADSADARVIDAYGYPLERAGNRAIIPIPDLRANETRKVVVRVALAPHEIPVGPLALAKIELTWHRPTDDAHRSAGVTAIAQVTDSVGEADPIDQAALEAIQDARSGRALEEANAAFDSHGAEAARQVLQLRAGAIGELKYLDEGVARRLRTTTEQAVERLHTMPATKARKVNAVEAYELSH